MRGPLQKPLKEQHGSLPRLQTAHWPRAAVSVPEAASSQEWATASTRAPQQGLIPEGDGRRAHSATVLELPSQQRRSPGGVEQVGAPSAAAAARLRCHGPPLFRLLLRCHWLVANAAYITVRPSLPPPPTGALCPCQAPPPAAPAAAARRRRRRGGPRAVGAAQARRPDAPRRADDRGAARGRAERGARRPSAAPGLG